jgi:hypothetical protein
LLAYNQVHMMTAETGDPERAQWIANLDEVAALEPALVDPKIIAESRQYLRDFTRIAAEETTTADGRTSAHSDTPPDQPSRGRT